MISLPGKITNISSDTKKTVLKYELSSEVKYADMIELQKLIGLKVFADFHNEQQELDDLEEDHEGVQYSVDETRVAKVSLDQTTIEDFIDETGKVENEHTADEEQQENEVEPPVEGEDKQSSEDELPDLTEQPNIDPDDLPFPVEEDGPGF